METIIIQWLKILIRTDWQIKNLRWPPQNNDQPLIQAKYLPCGPQIILSVKQMENIQVRVLMIHAPH